jgi:hypothetical protein
VAEAMHNIQGRVHVLTLIRVSIEFAISIEQVGIANAALNFAVVDNLMPTVQPLLLSGLVDISLACPQGVRKNVLVRLHIVVHECLDLVVLYKADVQADFAIVKEIELE